MIALASLNDLNNAQKACEDVKNKYSDVYDKLVHVISLTRQLSFKYQYFCCLMTGEEANAYTPKYVRKSILNLYHQQVKNLKSQENIAVIKELLLKHKACGFDNLCLLILDRSPEKLKGI